VHQPNNEVPALVLAREIFGRVSVDNRVEPRTTDELPRPARGPAYGLDAYLGVGV
jgi:hypothetical protein